MGQSWLLPLQVGIRPFGELGHPFYSDFNTTVWMEIFSHSSSLKTVLSFHNVLTPKVRSLNWNVVTSQIVFSQHHLDTWALKTAKMPLLSKKSGHCAMTVQTKLKNKKMQLHFNSLVKRWLLVHLLYVVDSSVYSNLLAIGRLMNSSAGYERKKTV